MPTASSQSNGSSISWLYPPVDVDSYQIYIGRGILLQLAGTIIQLQPAQQYILITDDNLKEQYASKLQKSFQSAGRTLHIFSIVPGEHSKSRETKAAIEDWMLSLQCGRDTCMLALGGGVVGDLTGYIAATYMRGIPVIQLPTSLLAMVDSSIGGKTGIDTPNGKNLLGAFHRPSAVFIDIELLLTLPSRQFFNGMAESIKGGAIASVELFELLESRSDQIIARDLQLLAEVIHRSAVIKATVVKADEREGAIRSILNFGHSIGHAIEAYTQPQLLHGECVSIGMIEEAILARQLDLISDAVIRRLDNCLKLYQLPTVTPTQFDLPIQGLLAKMAVDKKNKGGKKQIVMLTEIGAVKANPYTTAIEDEQLIQLFHPAATIISGTVCNGSISVPGSKSLSNRILLMVALGRGKCRIRGLLHSQDTQVMLDSLRELGVQYAWQEQQRVLEIDGTGGKLRLPKRALYLHNAGTASRFLTSIAVLAPTGTVELTGNKRMQQRPIADLVEALRSAGVKIEYLNKEGCLPIRVASGGLPGGTIELNANVSSQYVSSLLQAAVHAQTPTKVILKGDAVVSKPFIDMTVQLMRNNFHINIQQVSEAPLTYSVENKAYDNPRDILVEGDASSASYPLALAAVTGGSVTVENVGSQSLQGDAQFYTLLERMGCTVQQTAMSTTVTGIKQLKALEEVDMDSMTDCFMTLAAVAAFAHGTTRIVNIANQRVKECDRIAATVSGLRAVGIDARELPTGVEIVGCSNDASRLHGATIQCHDDHRLAMSFSIVGSRVPNVVLDEKRCVDKTFPTFFEDVQKYLGLRSAAPADAINGSTTAHAQTPSASKHHAHKSVIVIGMRGSGKTTLGRHAAAAIGYRFIDIDEEIERKVGDIKQYVTAHGWEAFRAVELAVFRSVAASHPSRAVIACGGGIVEIEEARQLLKQHGNTVWLDRHIDDVVAYLAQDSNRPSFEPVEAYTRRLPHYIASSHYEFQICKGDHSWTSIQRRFVHFIQHITRLSHHALVPGSLFLALSCADVSTVVATLPQMQAGVDALELRVDLLASYDQNFIRAQYALLRSSTHLPIIFTVRSQREGGKHPSEEAAVFDLLWLALRLGVEYLDVECSWSAAATTSILQHRRHTQIIGSIHQFHSNGGSNAELAALFVTAAMNDQADYVKVVIMAQSTHDASRLMHMAHESPVSKPKIVLAMGSAGKVSRVLNEVASPVTHPLLPAATAPGQMTVQDVQHARQLLGLLPRREYYLFGTPISASPSPLYHNTGFDYLHLPWEYQKCETANVDDVQQMLQSPNFAGASVTIPLKEKVAPLLSQLSDAARTIGAVNTIVKRLDGRLYGDNTDWQGVYKLLRASTPSQLLPTDVAVVIGAGGTARATLYALSQLGFKGRSLLLHNPRTPLKAHPLAQEFNATAVDQLDRASVAKQLQVSASDLCFRIIASTLPGSAAYQPDPSLYQAATQQPRPVVFDASYIPYDTSVTSSASAAGCRTIHGIDLLVSQGEEQFRLWSGGRTAPLPIMEQTVKQQYFQQHRKQ